MFDPFTPPSARVADKPPEKGSPIKALLLGLAVDWGGTFLVGFVLSVVYAAILAATGATPEEVGLAMVNIPDDHWVAILGMLFGALCSSLGGYVCARVAKHMEFALGAVLAVLSTLLGLVLGFDQHSFLALVGLSAVSFFAVMFGVRQGAARNMTD